MKLNSNDNIIILGDAAICWRKDRKDMEAAIAAWENDNAPMLYFIDGNHENFDILKSLPVEDNEGIVSEHIRWLTRGTIKIFENKKCLFIGGADSIDKFRRIKHLSWWLDESITDQDIESIAADTYDYIFTHCCPRSILNDNLAILTDSRFDQDEVNHNSEDKLEIIKNRVDFKQWWFRSLSPKCKIR